AFGGLNRRLKEKAAESRWFETTGQAPSGRAKAAYWKIKIPYTSWNYQLWPGTRTHTVTRSISGWCTIASMSWKASSAPNFTLEAWAVSSWAVQTARSA